MKNAKKILAVLLAVSISLALSLSGFAATEGETTVTGTVQATVVSFTVPADTGFQLNPNGKTPAEMFVSSEFEIVNESAAPIRIDVSAFSRSGGHEFTDVAPTTHTDEEWESLSRTASESKIALALTVADAEDWASLTQTTPLYVVDVTSTKTIGVLNPGAEGTFKFTAKHGRAFGSALSTEYKIVFVCALA